MSTPLELLAEALEHAGSYAASAEAAPAAILWCDPAAEFGPVVPALRLRVPGLLTYGTFDAAARTGPALWLRAAADRQLSGVEWPAGLPPVLYLPGVGREVLRGAEDCPPELSLLVWFAVAGVFFGQPKQARDWTLRSFLAAQGSPVALDVPEDAATRAALNRATSRLFAESVASLRGRRWDAAALDGLLVENPDADMLAWIDGALTPASDPDRFAAFAGLSVKRFGFDPRKKSREDAAGLLARREKNWTKVWDRFAQGTGGHDEVVRLLGFHEPRDLLEVPDAYPRENVKRENLLRSSLLALAGQPAPAAAQSVRALEEANRWRRAAVWAKRGQAPLALALEHLAVLASSTPSPQHDPQALAEAYAIYGWNADDAALAALGCIHNGEDREAVVAALRAIYLPLLDSGAAALQALAASGKVPFASPAAPPSPSSDTALVFVDGLRMDLAHRLSELLRQSGAHVDVAWRWSGFPTVTATCKPLASPAAGLLAAGTAQDLLPTYQGKPATKPVLAKAIEAAGWTADVTLLESAPLWVEARSVDKAGEDNGAQLLPLLPGILRDIADAVLRLVRQGRRVQIVTDHGFLLMPGGLEKAELPSWFVEPATKARRSALLKDGAPLMYDVLPWTWNTAVLLATARGARAFYANVEYAHGGVSPQECVLPVLEVTADRSGPSLSIEVSWRRLMAKVRVRGGVGLTADIRVGAGTSGPTALLSGPKCLDDAGEVNLGIDDIYEGTTICVVVYRAESPDEILAMALSKGGG